MKSIKYLLLLFLSIKGIITYSQTTCDTMDVCDCAWRDLSPAGVMIGHEHSKGTWKISYRYMSMLMKDKLSGTARVDDNYVFNNYLMSPQQMKMDMHMLMAMYGITNKLSMMAMFNFNVNSMEMTMLPGTTHTHSGSTTAGNHHENEMKSTSSGLGDTKLYIVYQLVKHNAHHLFLSEGFSIPTGSITINGKDDDMMYPNTRLPYMMQMGSGTFDFMPSITYLLKQEKFSASVQVAGVLRPTYNSLNYHLPNEANANVWLAYKWLPWISNSIRVEENIVGKIVGYDVKVAQNAEPAGFPNNYGGQYTTAFAGLNFYFNRTWFKNTKLSVEYGMPVYQKVNGVQLAQKSTIYAGWLLSF